MTIRKTIPAMSLPDSLRLYFARASNSSSCILLIAMSLRFLPPSGSVRGLVRGIAPAFRDLGGLDRQHPADQHAKHEAEKTNCRPVWAVRSERADVFSRDAGVFEHRHDGSPAIATGWTLAAWNHGLGGIGPLRTGYIGGLPRHSSAMPCSRLPRRARP